MNEQEKQEFAGVKSELALFQINQLKKNAEIDKLMGEFEKELEKRIEELEIANGMRLLYAEGVEKRMKVLEQNSLTNMRRMVELEKKIENISGAFMLFKSDTVSSFLELKDDLKKNPKTFWDKILKR